MAAQPEPQANPMQEQPHEILINKGSPHLAGIDQMYENNPLSRAFLEKKGYKKEVKRERDKKSGDEIVYTTYPSGRMTKTIIRPEKTEADMEGDIPLTQTNLNMAVKQIKGIDALEPYLDKILEMGDTQYDKNGNVIGSGENNQLPHTHYLPTDANANYKSTISEGLETFMGATGLNATDLATNKAEEILERHFGESTNNYLKRIHKKKLENRKEKRPGLVRMVSKGLKKYGDFSESPSANMSDEELGAIANES